MNTLRLRKAIKGTRIFFNGNEDDYQKAVNAAGLPLNGTFLSYIINYPFRWSIKVEFTFRFNELVKTVPVDLETDQAVLLNDLSDMVEDAQTAAGLELGSSWTFDKRTWVARVL